MTLFSQCFVFLSHFFLFSYFLSIFSLFSLNFALLQMYQSCCCCCSECFVEPTYIKQLFHTNYTQKLLSSSHLFVCLVYIFCVCISYTSHTVFFVYLGYFLFIFFFGNDFLVFINTNTRKFLHLILDQDLSNTKT